MSVDLKKMYQEKVDFTKAISDALTQHSHFGIDSVDYDVFEKDGETYEFVIVTYEGGAKSVIDTTGSSLSVILQEVSAVVDNGNYEQLERYKMLKEGSKSFDFNEPTKSR